MHFDGLAELLIEAEADEHDPIPVYLQLRALVGDGQRGRIVPGMQTPGQASA